MLADDLRVVFENNLDGLVFDFAQLESQTTHTTKLDRRAKSLAYILDMLTGLYMAGPEGNVVREEDYIRLLRVIDAIRANCKTGEAQVALDRSERRIRWRLEHKETFLEYQKCHSCGDLYKGKDHKCTNLSSKMRDIAMARDPDLE